MNQDPKPKVPKSGHWLISRCIQEGFHEEFLGDLEEIYQDRLQAKGKMYAQLSYWVDVLHLLIGFSSLKAFRNQYNTITMYKHYLLIAWRHLLRHKFYSTINLLSLAVGMGVCLLIYQYVYHEMTYDRFHKNYENIYRVIIKETNSDLKETYPSTGYALGAIAQAEIPEIKSFVRKERFNKGAIIQNPVNEHVFHEEGDDLLFVDSSFFSVFSFPLISGKKENLFDDSYSLVLTEKSAQKYFGNHNPIGKTLTINGSVSPGNYTVKGVLKDLPANSHLNFAFLLPMSNYIEYGWGGAVKKQDGWTGFSVVTYLRLDEKAELPRVSKKLTDLIAKYTRNKRSDQDIIEEVMLQPLSDIYLKSGELSWVGYLRQIGSLQNIKIFSLVASFILILAWVNYINLSTALSMYRAREVGIRKSLGAHRPQILSQFLMESFLVNVLSALLAICIAYVLLPILNQITGKAITLNMLYEPMFWLGFIALVVGGAILSGIYPAFILSSFKPSRILGSGRTSLTRSIQLRKVLILFQFLISLLLLSGTYLIYRQTSFMKSQALGIDIDKILILRSPRVKQNSNEASSKFAAFKAKLLEHHSIGFVSSSLLSPGDYWVLSYRKLGKPESETPHSRGFYASLDFEQTYGLELMAGSTFSPEMPDEKVVIINEAALRAFDLGSPENAIDQKLVINTKESRIVGVVKNFHWHSLAESHKPYVIQLFNEGFNPYISINLNLSNSSESLAYIEDTYRAFFPNNPFEYFFADKAFNQHYQNEVQFRNIFFAFTLLTLFIACIGLFALVSFSATMKTKEIGIRKILGASIQDLMILLAKEYFILLSLAIAFMIPLFLYGAKTWLENYAYRVPLSLDLIIIPAFILIILSLLSISYRMFIAANANPVDSLRAE